MVRITLVLFFVAGFPSIVLGGAIRKEPTSMRLPVILPQVQIEPHPKDGFVFRFNNCDGGFFETVVFEIQSGEIVFVTFSTPTSLHASPSQIAMGTLSGTDRLTTGWKGQLTLKVSPADKNRFSLHGTLGNGSGGFAEDANGNCQTQEGTQVVDLKSIPYSRSPSSDFNSILSDLQSLPGLKNAKLSKICK